MTRTQLQSLFSETGFHPSKKLGQNFLIDQNVSAWIVGQLTVESGDTVVEVGPGMGALTGQLRERCDQLELVEFDHRLAQWLKERFAGETGVTVHEMDACQFDTRQLYPHQPVKLIGNLPYSAAGEIMRNFTGIHSPVSEAVLMLQREVAARICAEPRTKDYGLLTLRMQSRWKPRILKHIGPDCFYPRPLIDSTVVRLTPREPGELPIFDPRLFDSLLRRGFAQRRKQLRKGLGVESENWTGLAEKLGIPGQARAEELSLEEWVELARHLDDHPLKDHPQSREELFDVVDDANQVIGQETRGRIHEAGLKHRAVHIFVYNEAGELFLQKRSRLKDVHPGAWDSSAAGHLNAGEDYAETAKRELEEELGLQADVERVLQLPPSASNGWEFIELYRASSKGKLRWPASEIEFGQFFPVSTIASWIEKRPQDFAGGFLECWRALKERSA